jgi:hypothetical protein
MPLQRLVGLVIGWWDEDILAKGSLVATSSFLGGGTFRWGFAQRRGCDLHPATTEPMELYFTA